MIDTLEFSDGILSYINGNGRPKPSSLFSPLVYFRPFSRLCVESSFTVAVTFDCVFKPFTALRLIPQIHGFNLLNLHQYSGNMHAVNRANRDDIFIVYHRWVTL